MIEVCGFEVIVEKSYAIATNQYNYYCLSTGENLYCTFCYLISAFFICAGIVLAFSTLLSFYPSISTDFSSCVFLFFSLCRSLSISFFHSINSFNCADTNWKSSLNYFTSFSRMTIFVCNVLMVNLLMFLNSNGAKPTLILRISGDLETSLKFLLIKASLKS